jgi:hypothetical protein
LLLRQVRATREHGRGHGRRGRGRGQGPPGLGRVLRLGLLGMRLGLLGMRLGLLGLCLPILLATLLLVLLQQGLRPVCPCMNRFIDRSAISCPHHTPLPFPNPKLTWTGAAQAPGRPGRAPTRRWRPPP